MKTWYAVQETRDDAWDNGSLDYNEAVKMAQKIAKETGEAIIAYINEETNFCFDEEVIKA